MNTDLNPENKTIEVATMISVVARIPISPHGRRDSKNEVRIF